MDVGQQKMHEQSLPPSRLRDTAHALARAHPHATAPTPTVNPSLPRV
jgi:hypothetical protein